MHYLVKITIAFCCLLPIVVQAQTDIPKKIKLTKDSLAIAKDLLFKNRKLGEPIARRVFATAANYKELQLEYADAHNILALYTMYSQKFEESEQFLTKGLKIANDISAKSIANKINSNFINLYLKKGDYQKGLKYALLLLPNFENDKIAKANTLANIAVFYNYLDNFKLSVKYQLEAQEIFLELNNKFALSNGYNVLSVCYKNLGDYEKSKIYAIKSIDIKTVLSDTLGVINGTINLATVLHELKDYDLVYLYLKKAEDLCLKYGSNVELAKIYSNISTYYQKTGNESKALEYDLKSVKIVDSATDIYTRSKVYLNLSRGYGNLGIYDSAYVIRLYADSLLKSLNDINNRKLIAELQTKYETEKKELTINLLSKSDSIKGLKILGQELAIRNNLLKIADQNLALTEADLQLTEDSLTIRTNNEIILKNKLDAQQKEEKISLLAKQKRIQELEVNKKNNTIIALGIGILLIAFAGFAFYKQRTTQQQAKLQLAVAKEQDIAMQGIIEAEEKERQRIAVELHDGVGQVMTAAWLNLNALKNEIAFTTDTQANLFNTSLELVDGGCKEVRSVSHNMMPNALVKKGLINAVREFIQQINTNKLSINLQTNGLNNPLPNHIETVLYRVIQESVNNVVKHANASNLEISINQEVDGVDVIIEDNGIGFNTKTPRDTDGIGLMNIKNRVQYLKGTVEWNSEPNKGTAVAIYIPVENANS